jgi:hypothetical protein
LNTEYVVIHSEAKSAKILQDGQEKGVLKKLDRLGVFELESKAPAQNWILTHKVDGEVRPFSIACYSNSNVKANEGSTQKEPTGELCLKIKEHIFFHRSNFYSIGAAVPAGASPGDFSTKMKFICRLVNFPFADLDNVDGETKHKLRRHRGIAVGEIYGLGAEGYHVKIYGDELADIGLPLTASTYLLYTTR